MQRLEWKNSLIKNFDELKYSDPVDLSISSKKEFIKIKSKGVINRSNKIFFPAKTHHGKVGKRLASEFITEKGNRYLIDEGWFKNTDYEHFKNNQKKFKTFIVGYIRYTRDPKLFTPKNDLLKNEWYTYDLEKISKYFSSPINQLLFIKKINPNEEKFLIPSSHIYEFRNNHLQYAITWFFMSFTFLIMFLVYLKKNKNE